MNELKDYFKIELEKDIIFIKLLHYFYEPEKEIEEIKEIREVLRDIISKNQKKHDSFKLMLDVSYSINNKEIPSLAARREYQEIIKEFPISRMAIYGKCNLKKDRRALIIVNAILMFFGRKMKAKFFNDEKKAWEWLKE